MSVRFSLLHCLLPSIFVYFQCCSSVYGDAGLTDPAPTPINRDLYHSSADLMDEIKSLVNRHPDKLSIDTVTSASTGYEAEITTVTYCQSRKDSDEKSKFRILLSFGQHGRELITTELALRILLILSDEQFLPKVVPMENLRGRELVEAGDLCERKNGRGVDLNRNWGVDWGKKEKDYDPYEENPGAAPFSEPETQIMRKLALSFDPRIWVNVHSGMEALYMPYDPKNVTPVGLPAYRMKLLLEELNKFHCHKRCIIGSGGGSVGCLTRGTATDYMYDNVKVPMAFTFEIYGDTASTKDCFKMFNPVNYTTFNRVLNDWSAAFFTIFKLGPDQLDLHSKTAVVSSSLDKWISIDEYFDGYLLERKSRHGKMEVIEVGMQEIRTYFRLFLLSSVLLLFMFCSRISKLSRQIVSSMPLSHLSHV